MRSNRFAAVIRQGCLMGVGLVSCGLTANQAAEAWPVRWNQTVSKLVFINPYPATGKIDDQFVRLRAIEAFNPGTLGWIGRSVRSEASPNELSDRAAMNARLNDAITRTVGRAMLALKLTERDRLLLATAPSVRARELQAPRVVVDGPRGQIWMRDTIIPPQPVGPGPCIDKETDCIDCDEPDGSVYCPNQCVYGCKEPGINCAEFDIDDPLIPYTSSNKCSGSRSPSEPTDLEIDLTW